jgi:hypothetical protein
MALTGIEAHFRVSLDHVTHLGSDKNLQLKVNPLNINIITAQFTVGSWPR